MSLSKNEIKLVKSLQIKKYRDLNRLFVVEGVKLVRELLEQTHFKIDGVFYTKDFKETIPNNIHSFEINESELERISGLKSPNAVLAVVKYPAEAPVDFAENNLVLVLDNVNDPGNLGTIIRTADWFGVQQIIASVATVDLFNPKVIQASMGAVYRVRFYRTNLTTAVQELKASGFEVVGAALGGENLYQNSFQKKTALVMGSESHGISPELVPYISKMILIPQFGETESLNVAMASGIILSHYKSEHNTSN
ncbi:MAG: RNA methyltransferase [Crocinitomix sp.]|nr:RNA methyltransferase [Crocinitomix sp.]